jgi:hypothetical protein
VVCSFNKIGFLALLFEANFPDFHNRFVFLRPQKSRVEKKVEKWHSPPAGGVITFHKLEACATLKP